MIPNPIELPDGTTYFPSDGQFAGPQLGEFFRPHRYFPSDATLKAEIRAVTLGTPRYGYYNVAPFYWFAFPEITDPMIVGGLSVFSGLVCLGVWGAARGRT